MREILFRGKRVDNGEWIYGSYVQQYGATMIYLPNGVDSEHGFDYYHVDPETVGQYTELTDKNGVRIFEGDIIEYDCPDNGKSIHVVKWEDWCWNLFDFYKSGFDYPSCAFSEGTYYMTVIGNTHDNPELPEVSICMSI